MKRFLLAVLVLVFAGSAQAQIISKASAKLVGVQGVGDEQVGSIAELLVEVHEGTGRVFVDTMPLTEIDTQTSARLASQVACSILDINCSGYDFFYIIRSNSPMIGGPSAGGSMALATLLALTNASKDGGIVMTGTINPDGTIGPVGGVLAKAEAVYKSGFHTFLVPPTQSIVYTLDLEAVNLTEYALSNWGLSIAEVGNLEDAFAYFTGSRIEREDVSGVEIVTPSYNDLMRFMASSLFERFKLLNSEFNDKFSNSKISYSMRQELLSAVNNSELALNNVTSLFNEGDYYVTASRSLQESMNAKYYSYLIDYDSAASKSVFVKSFLDAVSAEINFFVNTTNYSVVLDNIYDLELVVASLDRFREAESIISSAFETYYSGDYRGALYLATTASERLETARVWLNTTNQLKGLENVVFNASKLAGLASSSLSDASTSITYASTVVSSSLVSSLQRELDLITDSFVEGKYARTIFESLGLVAESNLLMETRGLDEDLLNSLFLTKRENVVRLIAREESKDKLPILAVSYLLYGDYFFGVGDLYNALRYLNYAAQYSSLSSSVFSAVTGETVSGLSEGYNLVVEKSICSDGSANFFLGFIAASITFLILQVFRLVIP